MRECVEVFPAHAGMSRILVFTVATLVCFPRSRGDEPRYPQKSIPYRVFSPLTRG